MRDRELKRSDCWRLHCNDEPDGWIIGNGDRFEVCESCGETLARFEWDRYVSANEVMNE